MRIISGKYKNTKLFMPEDKNTRPLKDIVRESIFNTLIHSNKFLVDFKQKNILDLFSGTGSFGLECMSREASKVTFVENSLKATKVLLKNINKIKLQNTSKIKIVSSSVLKFINNSQNKVEKFDLIFLDPPFNQNNIYELLVKLKNINILKNNGIMIIHRHKGSNDQIPKNLKIEEEKIYGLSKISFIV